MTGDKWEGTFAPHKSLQPKHIKKNWQEKTTIIQ